MRADINSKLIKAVSDFGSSSKRIERLLMDGANPNAADKEGKTALMHAVSPWGKIDAVNPLIAAGAEVNAADNNGKTALMHAVSDSYIPAVELLIAAGADANARDNDGKTALMHVKIPTIIDQTSDQSGASAALGLAEMNIKLLLDAGADVNAADNEGKTALALAQESGGDDVAAVLRTAGAKD
ncbi:MAG: ankyrin repeat domain-containing protein [Ottowia sp.]|nr:ankyrin repeat domain-containing protein [Ottowia sp.]